MSKDKYIFAIKKPRIWYRIFGISTRFPANDVECFYVHNLYKHAKITKTKNEVTRREKVEREMKETLIGGGSELTQKGNLLLFREIFLTEKIAISCNPSFHATKNQTKIMNFKRRKEIIF